MYPFQQTECRLDIAITFNFVKSTGETQKKKLYDPRSAAVLYSRMVVSPAK